MHIKKTKYTAITSCIDSVFGADFCPSDFLSLFALGTAAEKRVSISETSNSRSLEQANKIHQ